MGLIHLFITVFNMKNLKNIFFGITVILLFIPLLYQVEFLNLQVEPLKGAFQKQTNEPFSWSTWFSKDWQENKQLVLKSDLNVKPNLVRLQHQIDYSAFGAYHMNNFLEGKNQYFFSRSWTNSRCCKNELNIDSLGIFVEKLARLNQVLHQKGKYFQIIIPPSKEELFSNQLPQEFQTIQIKNDYQWYTDFLNENGIKYWDLLEKYQQIQDTSSYPAYSKTSVHWTTYGAHFTLLELLDSMNLFYNNSMNKLKVKKFDYEKFRYGTSDGDYEQTLNLMYRIDQSTFAYPFYDLNPQNEAFKPKVLTIGDSYYWAIKGSWMLDKIYHPDSRYLYYYSTAFSVGSAPSIKVSEMDIVKEFQSADAIILINSSHNLEGFPFGMENDIDAIIEGLQSLPNKPESK